MDQKLDNQDTQNQAVESNQSSDKASENNELQQCLQSVAEWKDKYLRSSAELQNYIKRVDKERMLWMHNAYGAVLLDLLPIVDDFDRALSEHKKEHGTQEHAVWLEGFVLIHKQLYKLLEKYNVQPIEQMQHFDPNLHEALARVQSDTHEPDDIVEVFQKGFMIDDRVLRPAKVSVAQ